MKKTVIGLMLLLTSSSFILNPSAELKNFNELLTALKEGKNIRVIIHYAKCRLVIDGREEKSPEAIGGMDLKTFEYFARKSVKNDKAFIASSETVLIFHQRYGYVFNYIKIRIYEDESVEIIARYLDPKTYEVKMDETFYSSLNKENESAVIIFAN